MTTNPPPPPCYPVSTTAAAATGEDDPRLGSNGLRSAVTNQLMDRTTLIMGAFWHEALLRMRSRDFVYLIQKKEWDCLETAVRRDPRQLSRRGGWLSPLHLALKNGAPLSAVKALVEGWPPALLVKCNGGWTPLHVAAKHASFEVVKYLVSKNARPLQAKKDGGWTPLHIATVHSTFEIVQYLVRKDARPLQETNDAGWTPLHTAAELKSLEIVQCLGDASYDAFLMKTDEGGWTPLHVAALKSSFETVQYLGNKCPEALLAKSDIGYTPLHLAAQRESFEIVQYLGNKRPEALLAKSDKGYTPLHVAAQLSNNEEAVAFLAMTRPEGLSVKDRDGSFPIDLARQRQTDPDKFVSCLEAAEIAAIARGDTLSPPSGPVGLSDTSSDPSDSDRAKVSPVTDAMVSAGPVTASREFIHSVLLPITETLREVHKTSIATHQTVTATHEVVEATLPVLSHLDLRLNNPVPRLFLVLPAERKSFLEHPRSWLRSKVAMKYHLYFVCVASHEVVSRPIKFKAPKGWVVKAAPLLAVSLYLIQISIKISLNVTLDLGEMAASVVHVSMETVSQMLEETLGILKETERLGLKERLESKNLSTEDVQELNGEAYEFVVRQAGEQPGWRERMVPVRAPPSPHVIWVTNEVADDPMYVKVKA